MKTIIIASLIALTKAVQINYAYGDAQKERDEEAGYASVAASEDNIKFTNLYIEKNTGRFKTPYEVELEKQEGL